MERIVYHGSKEIVRHPELRPSRFTKDYSCGFYCTNYEEQAIRWATRYGMVGYVNRYIYREEPSLSIKQFAEMSEEWLDFIVHCRLGREHSFDLVEGPMADDTIFNYVQEFADGRISREAFWALAKFKRPTHQLCFHTPASLATISFVGYEAYGDQ